MIDVWGFHRIATLTPSSVSDDKVGILANTLDYLMKRRCYDINDSFATILSQLN